MNKPIPGFPGYFATDDGHVIGRWGRPLSAYRDRNGYMRVTMAVDSGKDAQRLHMGIHQAVCAAFNGPATGPEVRHLDGNKLNNHPNNLAWGTRQQNSDDRTAHGHVPQGESHGCAKLTADEVKSIRVFLATGLPQRMIAAWFGVSQGIVHCIHARKNWRNIK